MRKSTVLALAAFGVVALAIASFALAGNGGKKHVKSERLSSYNEVPALSTTGTGSFRADIDEAAQKITFELKYSGLTGNPGAAHIHFAQKDVNGAVVAWICGGGSKPACPASTSGTVTGTIQGPGDVVAAQGLDTFAELVAAIRAGRTYVNMHTALFMGGEIRGQLKSRHKNED